MQHKGLVDTAHNFRELAIDGEMHRKKLIIFPSYFQNSVDHDCHLKLHDSINAESIAGPHSHYSLIDSPEWRYNNNNNFVRLNKKNNGITNI